VRPGDVAEIWRAVREREPAARLLVVGRGAQGEERELAELPGAEVAGWLERDERRAAFARAAVAIAPWADTAPNRARHSAKVLEVMAAGLPVVAYRVGELAVTPGAAGVLVAAGSANEFARAVVALLRDVSLAGSLGERGRALVLAHFNWDALAEIALAAYRGEPSGSE
jgi:glycosyltransferase involved in cell wall biosynthesis